MSCFGQKEKRRALFAFAILVMLSAAFYYGFNLLQPENPAFSNGEFRWFQDIGFDAFSPLAIFFLLTGATLFSEDLACIAGGVLAAQGKISLPEAIAACAAGILLGDVLIFLAGRFFGRRALQWKIVSHFMPESAVEKSSRWLVRRGMKTVFISRFVFGMRLPLYFAAGALKTSFWRFTLYFSLAVAVWTPLVVVATYTLGAQAVKMSLFDRHFLPGLLAVAGILYISIRILQRLFTWRGRRILWGNIKRRFLWEFWSLPVFYFPIVVYAALLALKYRSLTVFTCANPAILASGFVGESKAEILRGLHQSESAKSFLLKHLFLPQEFSAAEKLQMSLDFMTENDLSFPVVLKPDVGERGFGVRIVRTAAELAEKLASAEDLILQEFAAGDETSVFYYRRPNRANGRIFAITEKRFPALTGDGVATLEELILRDRRAVCLAEKYFEGNRERLETIPARGENVKIIDIGTHSRGAVFLDGGWMKTDVLEAKIDEICRGFEGFYFGRFDIRVKSFADFKRAKNFKIVELNGVTSEATNIYDPQYSLFDAYRILFRQWRIAFEIGAANKKRGIEPTRLADLIKLALGTPIRNPKSEIQN